METQLGNKKYVEERIHQIKQQGQVQRNKNQETIQNKELYRNKL